MGGDFVEIAGDIEGRTLPPDGTELVVTGAAEGVGALFVADEIGSGEVGEVEQVTRWIDGGEGGDDDERDGE